MHDHTERRASVDRVEVSTAQINGICHWNGFFCVDLYLQINRIKQAVDLVVLL